MKGLILFAALFVFAVCFDKPVDMNLNTQEMAEAHGYPCENFTVETNDGYILKLFRIFGHRNESVQEARKHRRQPVILQHGLVDSSDSFLVNEEPALAYMLADADFDVWLPNFRGNKYTKTHKTLSPKDKRFWHFSVDEIIKFDLKAIFGKVINVTKFDKIHYGAHSMGGGVFLAAASRDPAFFGTHTKAYAGLSPSTRSLNSVYIIHLAHYMKILNTLLFLGVYEVMNLNDEVQGLFSQFCDSFPDVCSALLKLLADQHPDYDNEGKYGVFFNHYPTGTSTHVVIHMVQQSSHTGYCEYQRNLGDPLVEYDFTKFPKSVPVAIYAGLSDLLVSVKDAQWLKNKINTTGAVKEYKEYVGYGHLTFLLPGKYYDPYNDTLAFFKKY